MNLRHFGFVMLFIVLATACAETQTKPDTPKSSVAKTCPTCAASPRFSRECRLVVASCTRARISELDSILDETFAVKKPVVLYIHGRGNEPKKTVKQRILETLEADYGVKVLMFNWDSNALLFHRPVTEANEGAPYLRDVINGLARYRASHPETKAINVSLLVHSMGNLVLRSALDDVDLSTPGGPLLSNILKTGSDEDAEGHNRWVETLSARHTILITINEKDSTLRKSNHPDGKTPLGLNPKPPLATNAYYLDVTGLVGKVHRVFTKGKQHGRVTICEIVTSMLRGEQPNLTVGQTIKRVERGRILVPIAKQDKADKCFVGVRDEADEEDEGDRVRRA